MRPIHLLTLVAIIAACLLPTAAIAQNTSAISLLAQHKAYVGWQMGDNTIRSLILDGSISKMPDGSEPTYSVHAAYEGLAHRRTLTRTKDGTKTDNGFTGRVFWRSNENGFVHPETGDLQKYDISSDVLFGEGTTGFSKAEVRGNKTVDGVATTIVRIQPDPGFPIDLYLDPANGAYKRAVIDPDGAFETTVDILAYSDALPGKKIISKWRYEGETWTRNWTKIAANVPVSNDDLHPRRKRRSGVSQAENRSSQLRSGAIPRGYRCRRDRIDRRFSGKSASQACANG